MTDADRDRIAARTVGTPPEVLTDIALRRPDLHANTLRTQEQHRS